jgi:hypothetical protein
MKKILVFAVLSIFYLSSAGCLKSSLDYTGLLTLIIHNLSSTSGTTIVSGKINNIFLKNILTVYSTSDHSIIATTQTDSQGRWAVTVPPGDYNVKLYSTNPMILLDLKSPKALYEISQYELTVASDGKAMIKGVNNGNFYSYNFLSSIRAGWAIPLTTDNPQYVLQSRLMQGAFIQSTYGNPDVYTAYSYDANHRVTNVKEYLGIDATGTLYSDTTNLYNAAGSISDSVADYQGTANDTNTVSTYTANVMNSITKTGLVIGAGTNISQTTYTYDSSNRLIENKMDNWSGTLWNNMATMTFTWNTDNTLSNIKIIMTSPVSADNDYIFAYTAGNATQLDYNDNTSINDSHSTYTMNTANLPSGFDYATGSYPGPWTPTGTGTYTYEPTFGLLAHYTYGSTETYDYTYDSRGKQLSVSRDGVAAADDFYIVAAYDSNGNVSTLNYYDMQISAVGAPALSVAYTWQPQ